MKLLTDGTEKDSILAFCKVVISRHAQNWPPTEEVLAEEFVNWLGVKSFMTRSAMIEMCLSKGIKLSFVSLPPELHGFNCSFHHKKEIVISKSETVVFSDLHTLLHELREMLERGFVDLGRATLTAKDLLELKADEFAIHARMETGTREFLAYLEMVGKIEINWHRYFAYALLAVFSVAYLFSCPFLPQIEEMISEARHQRYVRTYVT
jgi:hypothetical protein